MLIWIVNYYTAPGSSNPRYLEFARHFQQRGWKVIFFNASFCDNDLDKKFKPGQIFLHKQYGEFDFVHVKAPHYIGSGLSRMKSIFSFAWNIYRHVKEFEHPDVILHNIHTPFDYPVVWAAKKLRTKYVAEAWDLWPEGFVRFGLISPNNPIIKIAYWFEKKVYYAADEIVITLPGGYDYLLKRGCLKGHGGKIEPEHLHYINNGVNLDEFENNVKRFPRVDSDMNDITLLKVVYLGSLKLVNHVKTLIDAAALLQNDKRYMFFIYGDGKDRSYLEQYVKEKNISNVVFKEKKIAFAECAWVVRQATVNIMNYNTKAGRWGMSSGKMFQYLAAGKPIVCNIDNKYDDVITENKLGVSHRMDTPEEFCQAIRNVAEQPLASYEAMCERVRETAKRFDYNLLAEQECKVLEAAVRS